jgi:hypothetical protein
VGRTMLAWGRIGVRGNVAAYRRRCVWASVCLRSCSFRFDPPLIGGNGEKRLATNTPIRFSYSPGVSPLYPVNSIYPTPSTGFPLRRPLTLMLPSQYTTAKSNS